MAMNNDTEPRMGDVGIISREDVDKERPTWPGRENLLSKTRHKQTPAGMIKDSIECFTWCGGVATATKRADLFDMARFLLFSMIRHYP
jgi:hypothetical protein